MPPFFHLEQHHRIRLLRLCSNDGTNRLTRACVLALIEAVATLRANQSLWSSPEIRNSFPPEPTSWRLPP
jgi:hypothetical protein